MTPQLLIDLALFPALRLLPVSMHSPAAMAMLVAIALQESRIKHRRQIGGPARSYWQFERGGGVVGVLTHRATSGMATRICEQLDVSPNQNEVYTAIEFNDVLACVFSRLLLWTLPQAMPPSDDPEAGWQAYIAAWRPGKPNRPPWNGFFEQAWLVVAEATKET